MWVDPEADGVDRAIAILAEFPVVVARGHPASRRALRAAERAIGTRFPPSYRRFLSNVGPIHIDYDDGSDSSLLVYGLTKRSASPDVVWRYNLGRTEEPRRFLQVAQRRIGSLRHLPYRWVALDLAQKDRASDEYPVVTNNGSPHTNNNLESNNNVVMNSFGAWLEETLQEVVPLSVEMWQKRINYPSHATSTREYGQPGPPVFVARCECGWSSHLKLSWAEARHDGEIHSSDPAGMHAQSYWE